LWVVAAAASLAACSSCSTSSNDKSGSSTDGGAGDTGGPGGITADEACNHFAMSLCGQLNTCAPFVFQTIYGDTMTCITRTSLGCLPALGANGNQTTPAQLDACAQAIGSETCDAAADNAEPQACDLPGTLAAGAGCGSNAQCQSGYCKIPLGKACGTCTARAAAGAACSVDVDCAAGLVCSGTTCVMPAATGAACSMTQPCMRTLACIGGQCATPLAAGATCSGPTGCDASKGLYCDMQKTCAQTGTAPAGQPCGIIGSSVVACTAGATCAVASGISGTCHQPAADGALCGPGIGCLAPATCIGGKCQLPSPSSCH
jgi:hypothetical protein